ncbi:hypothetical protein [Nocardia sp. NPDC057227]|uniref:hypothetical protein n=1 Tax=Nocardia sp. NPDC057227 TaxID=3346056 RepID=UPI00362AB0D8
MDGAGTEATGVRLALLVAGLMSVVLLTSTAICSPGVANSVPPGHNVSGVRLTAFPFPEELGTRYGATFDQALLDLFAREYARTSGAEADVEDFLLWWLPSRLTGIAYGSSPGPAGLRLDPADPGDFGKMVGLAHLCGFFLGDWIFAETQAFGDPENPATGLPIPGLLLPDRLVSAHYDDAGASIRTATIGTPDEVMERTRYSMRGDGRLFFDNNFGMLGYDAGYLDLIMRTNRPDGVDPGVEFDYDPAVLLGIRYGADAESYVELARAEFERATVPGSVPAARARAEYEAEPGLLRVQRELSDLSRGLWSLPLLSVRRWDADSYRKLVRNGYYAVQQNEANARASVAAYALEDIDLGRRHLRATALWRVYIGQYLTGLADHSGAGRLAGFLFDS